MKAYLILGIATLVLGMTTIGCQKAAPPAAEHGHGTHEHETDIQASLAKLSPADRAAAKDQGYCANEPDSPLGSMGTPIKLTVKDRPVFVCCEGCSRNVLDNPDKALATVDRLKADVAAAKK